MTQKPPVGQRLLINQASRSHSDTPHLVGLVCTRDQFDTETSTWQHKTLIRADMPAPVGIQTNNPRKRAAVDPRFTLCGHCHRQRLINNLCFSSECVCF